MSRPDALARREDALGRAVRLGLGAAHKTLPPWLFYDAAGSALFERITELEEYYLTRTERGILERHAAEVARRMLDGAPGPVHVVELGAGTATKSQLVLSAFVREQGPTLFLPVDVSADALEQAMARLRAEEPHVRVRPLRARHEEALPEVARLGPRRLVLFIGSSIGNLDDGDAVALFRGVRRSLLPGGALLLGADRRKDPSILIAAYDDALGVTAAFNKNVLARINRELGGRFDLDAFRHRARWNDRASRVEMHLESTRAQRVRIDALGLEVDLAAGETIHTESSAKYDDARLHALVRAAGFAPERTFEDDRGWFGVHLCRAV